jgi:hypothetical protein
MEANYLNMEGGAWGSSQVGGSQALDAEIKKEFKKVTSAETSRNMFTQLKKTRGDLRDSETELIAIKNRLKNAAQVPAAQVAADTYLNPLPPTSASDQPYTSPDTETIIEYRNKLSMMHPGKVANAVEIKAYLGIFDNKRLAIDATKQANLDAADNRIKMAVMYALQHAKINNGTPDETFKYTGKSPDSSGASNAKLTFLPEGGVTPGYENHLPSSNFISGLPGAFAIANFQPLRLMSPVMSHSLMAQSGGGAIIYSNAPSVRKYCGDGNFLADRVEQQLKSLQGQNIGLTQNSVQKVNSMISMLKATEESLCQTHDQLDAYLGSKGETKPGSKVTGNLEEIQSNLTALKARKRKISGQALSTIMTLEDVMYKAASNALKDNPNPVTNAKSGIVKY